MANMQIEEHKQLSHLTTMGVAAEARYYTEINSEEELQELIQTDTFKENDRLILGGGSNVLFTQDFDGLVVHVNNKGVSTEPAGGTETSAETARPGADASSEIILTAKAGENWHELVEYAVKRGWGGIENLALIPGSVGATPVQNIGAYGVELRDVFYLLEAIDLETGELREFSASDCKFGYRDSAFKNEFKGKYIITQVSLKLTKAGKVNTSYGQIESVLKENEKDPQNASIQDVFESVVAIRQSKLPDPKEIGNSGSFFKNPIISTDKLAELEKTHGQVPHYDLGEGEIKLPAAWLIDQAGWKGWTSEDKTHGVHKKHALILVNYKNATGKDISELSMKIKTDIEKKFGIGLEPEVNIV